MSELNIEAERALFEAWATGPEWNWTKNAMWKMPNGEYGETETKHEWEIWQAARRAPVSTPHTPPVAEQASTQAGIDSLEFRELLDEFAYRASERRAMGGDFGSAEADEIAETALIAHIDAKLTEARRADRDHIDSLYAALRSLNAVAIERGDKYGACDQIDNTGAPYQSDWLSKLLKCAAAPASNTQEGK